MSLYIIHVWRYINKRFPFDLIQLQVYHFQKVPFGHRFIERFDRFFYKVVYCHVEFPFKFFDKIANKINFPKIIHLYSRANLVDVRKLSKYLQAFQQKMGFSHPIYMLNIIVLESLFRTEWFLVSSERKSLFQVYGASNYLYILSIFHFIHSNEARF